jgi:hypothetical protein
MIGAVILMALVGVTAIALMPRVSRVTEENYDRIGGHMSRAEVYAILGPPGDYSTGPQSHHKGTGDWWTERIEQEYLTNQDVWDADGLSFTVYYDSSGSTVGKLIVRPTRIPQGPLDNILWRAKRQWRKWFPS